MNASSPCLPERSGKQEQQNESQTMTFVPQTNEEDALKWIGCEYHKSYHAVSTWSFRPARAFDEMTAPPAHRRHCRSRFRCSLLVPDSRKALRNEAVNGRPGQHQ